MDRVPLCGTFGKCRLWLGITLAGSSLGLLGCAGSGTARNGSDRDPFVMSHLTHGKGDPAFAGTENAYSLGEDPAGSTKWASNKPRPLQVHGRLPGFAEPPSSSADVPRQLTGTLGFHEGPMGGWHLRYGCASSDDPLGGQVQLADHERLGLLRVGDRVYVTGHLVPWGRDGHRLRIQSIRLADSE